METQFTSLEDVVVHVTENEPLFAVEEVDIRNVRLKTFANAARHIGALMDYCDEYGDAEFIVFEEERYSYNDFRSQVNRLARVLKTQFGVSKGDRVAICMRNYPEYLTAIMAIASLGGVIVFLNSWWTTQELEYGFTDSGAKLVFTESSVAKRMEPIAGRLGLTQILVRSEGSSSNAYNGLIDAVPVADIPVVDVNTDDDMAIMYTSGSTGHPKGVVQTHRGAISALMSWLFAVRIAELTGLTPDMPKDESGADLPMCSLITTPLFHVSATHACFFMGLILGAKLVMMNKWDAEVAVNLIEGEKVTRFFGVPTMSADILNTAASMGKTLGTLRHIDAGGAKCPASQVAKLAKGFPSAEPRSGFGLTESNALGLGIGGEEYLSQPGAAGRLYPPLQEMRIVNDTGEELPIGDVGELILKSAANMRCYLNKPEATAEALKDGWLYTGDLAVVDKEGLVTIVDRKKDIIIRGGENISCLEVDAAFYLHPSVSEAAVFSVPDERLGEVVGAGVVLRQGHTLTQNDLQDFLRAHLAAFKVPEKIWFLDHLPRGGTEKIDRRALRAEYISETSII